jgi:hypothetical protein
MIRNIKPFGFTLILCLACLTVNAQTTSRTSYFVENSTHRHLMNPALAPVRGYFAIPGIGELYVGNESNMKFTNFIYPANDQSDGKLRTFLHPSVDADDFLTSLKEDQSMNTDIRTSLFSFGYWAGKSSFITFDVAARANINLNLPYDLFAFLKKGMSDGAGNTYNLKNLSVSASAFAETSLGYSVDLTDKLRIGFKTKFLAGGARVKANLEQLEIVMSPDEWTITTQGQLDVYGKGFTFVKDADQNITGVEYDQSALGLAGMGMAFDLGFEYTLIPGLKLSMAVVDIGGIKWNKDYIKTATSSGTFSYTGIQNYNPDSTGKKDAEQQLTDIEDNLMALTKFQEKSVAEDLFERLNPMVNVGVEYSLKRISVGGLMTTRFMGEERYTEYTASINLKPLRMFNLSGSYSFIHGIQETFGVALGFSPGLINVFVACDYVPTKFSPQFVPLNTLNTNFQIGVSIPLSRRRVIYDTDEEEELAPETEEFIITE